MNEKPRPRGAGPPVTIAPELARLVKALTDSVEIGDDLGAASVGPEALALGAFLVRVGLPVDALAPLVKERLRLAARAKGPMRAPLVVGVASLPDAGPFLIVPLEGPDVPDLIAGGPKVHGSCVQND